MASLLVMRGGSRKSRWPSAPAGPGSHPEGRRHMLAKISDSGADLKKEPSLSMPIPKLSAQATRSSSSAVLRPTRLLALKCLQQPS